MAAAQASTMETILVGDIGGTNTRLVLFQVRRDDPQVRRPLKAGRKAPGLLLKQDKYLNQEYASFSAIITQFLHEANLHKPPLTACFAVAGPVHNNSVTFTNRDAWKIDGRQLESQLGIARVTLCNDFLAVGYGLLTLEVDAECEVLQHAPRQPGAPIACIGAGTGLGECFLTPSQVGGATTTTTTTTTSTSSSPSSLGNTGSSGDMASKLRGAEAPSYQYQYQCFASEGGHTDFSPRDEEQTAMVTYLKRKFGQDHRISVERVVSGTGLANIYEFLWSSAAPDAEADGDAEAATAAAVVRAEVEAAGDLKGAIIAKHQHSDARCCRTMDIFAAAYGAEAGDAALKFLPFGGLFLTGGLTPKNMALLRPPQGPFMRAFRDKGRLSGVLEGVPVFAVKAEDLGERGAHYLAFSHLQATLGLEEGAKVTGRRRAAALKWLSSLVLPISAAYVVTVVSVAAVVLWRRR